MRTQSVNEKSRQNYYNNNFNSINNETSNNSNNNNVSYGHFTVIVIEQRFILFFILYRINFYEKK